MNNIVAIVGRPNVGKSTLYNRLTGTRNALVHPKPGTTRDYNEAVCSWDGKEFNIIDTAGWDNDDEIFSKEIKKQMQAALKEADIIIFTVDAKAGLTAGDIDLNNFLRTMKKKIILAINKVDTDRDEAKSLDFYELGLPDPVLISANQGRNINELLEEVCKHLIEKEETESPRDNMIHITLIGKPNVGKSTLFNKLYKKERSIVSDKPGTTREAIDIVLKRDDQSYVLIDTPGLGRKNKIKDDMEYLSALSANKALERTDVAVLLIDAQQGIGETEAKIAEMILENRCACLLAVNKWDLVEEKEYEVEHIDTLLDKKLKFLSWVKIIYISAKTGLKIERILDETKTIYKEYSKKIPDIELRRLIETIHSRKAFGYKGDPIKVRKITQLGTCPPVFGFVMNNPEILHFSHKRFFENMLREFFGFEGTPISLVFSKEKL
jgi:GTP-binding protein